MPGGSTWHLYALCVATAATCPAVPHPPDSIEFFCLQALIWGTATYFFYHARRRSWERAGLPDGPLELQPWKDAAPCWCYEAAFLVQLLTNVPAGIRMALVACTSREALLSSATLYGADYTESLWFERVLFAQLFGYMCRDLVMQGRSADPLLTVHHITTVVLMVCFNFLQVPGIRLLALQLCVVELGTCGYCQFVVWRNAQVYKWLMHLSNIFMILGSTAIVCLAETRTNLLWFLFSQCVGLFIGRTGMMVFEIREDAKRLKFHSDIVK